MNSVFKSSAGTFSACLATVALVVVTVFQWISVPPQGNRTEAEQIAAATAGGKVEWTPVSRGKVKERDAWFLAQRAYPRGAIPAGALQKALRQRDILKAVTNTPFTQVGPAGFTSNVAPLWGQMSGRTRDLAIDPTNPDRLFLATATGGVWRSLDGGASWTSLTDTQASLAGSAVAIDPNNPNVIYAGTGEGPQGAYYGVGILKSTDGGSSWTLNAGDTFARHAISDILVDPMTGSVLACSTSAVHTPGSQVPSSRSSLGVFRSTDGGVSFTQTSNDGHCEELVADPSNFTHLYASLIGNLDARDGLYKSIDGGQTFTQLIGGGAPTGTGRLAIGISADGTTLYAGGKDSMDTTRIWKSTDSGASWTALVGTPDYCKEQCDYDNVIAVSPDNPNVAYFGGVPLYRTVNGGASFEQIGDDNTSSVRPLHVDHHVLKFQPGNADILYNGNDGGLYRSSDAQAPLAAGSPGWTSLGGTLATSQLYGLALHPTDAGIMLGGFQDNGTELRSGGNLWSERCGGDGGVPLIDHGNPLTMYCTFSSDQSILPISKSTDGGSTFPGNASLDTGTEVFVFIPPIAMDPATATTLYTGAQRLWRTTDGGGSWNAQSNDSLTDSMITGIAIAPSSPSTIYVVTSGGEVQVSSNSGVDFTDTTQAPLPNRYATSVAVDPTDPAIAYVGFSGFDDGDPGFPGHLFKTTDAGDTWSDVTGGLPDTPVNAIAVRPDVASEIYAGTDVGLFLSTDSGATWTKMTNGLPNAAISDIDTNVATDLLAVSTYGRSVFTAELSDVGSPTDPTLTVAKAGTGSGTVTSAPAGIDCGADCSEQVPVGTEITLTAAAAAGSTFAGWSGGCSGLGTCVVTVNDDTEVTATFNADGSQSCDGVICLNANRFQVDVDWRTAQGTTGQAVAVPGVRSDDSGVLYFFTETNWEMLIKVLDGCAITDHFWVFAAATTDVEYTLTVTDTQTLESTTYFNPLGTAAAAITDTSALAVCNGMASPSPEREVQPVTAARSYVDPLAKQGSCAPSATHLCLNQSRFQVEVAWQTAAGGTGSGTVVPFNVDDSGLFFFFSENNWEMLIKVLNGCAITNHYWVFAAATTDVGYTLKVTDTQNGMVKEYSNPIGQAAPATTDTSAFATCP